MTLKKVLGAAMLVAASTSTWAAAIVVTPADVGASPVLNQWYLTNYRDASTGFAGTTTVAAINGSEPRNGNGSVQMSTNTGAGKADYAYTWGFVAGRTLGTINALSYDWFRDAASTNPASQQPALRLLYDADGSNSTTGDRGYLVWEQVYNGVNGANDAAVPTGQWVSSNIIGDEFWQRQFSTSTTVADYDITLMEWANGADPAGNSDVLSGSTAILGIEFGIGSGWNGVFNGYIDNVSFGFGTEGVTNFNFETQASQVPEPSSLALVGVALAGIGILARRRRV